MLAPGGDPCGSACCQPITLFLSQATVALVAATAARTSGNLGASTEAVAEAVADAIHNARRFAAPRPTGAPATEVNPWNESLGVWLASDRSDSCWPAMSSTRASGSVDSSGGAGSLTLGGVLAGGEPGDVPDSFSVGGTAALASGTGDCAAGLVSLPATPLVKKQSTMLRLGSIRRSCLRWRRACT